MPRLKDHPQVEGQSFVGDEWRRRRIGALAHGEQRAIEGRITR
jgi:hypothetical protein